VQHESPLSLAQSAFDVHTWSVSVTWLQENWMFVEQCPQYDVSDEISQ
jgi:hypothetical protein